MKQLKILIADDAKAIREVLESTLAPIEGFTIVGTAADGVAALELVNELQPHLLVLDISMPLKNGVEVIQEIRANGLSTAIVVFTGHPLPDLRKLCLEAGANYFLDKCQIRDLIKICVKELLAR